MPCQICSAWVDDNGFNASLNLDRMHLACDNADNDSSKACFAPCLGAKCPTTSFPNLQCPEETDETL